jgi:hypothetical protein
VGKVMGAVIGAFIMGVMNNGMSIMGIGIDYQQMIKGLVLLMAVCFASTTRTSNRIKQGGPGARLLHSRASVFRDPSFSVIREFNNDSDKKTRAAPCARPVVRYRRQERFHVPQLDEEPGHPDHEFQGKPIIGICNTWSELTPATRTSASWPNTSSAASSKPVASRWNSRCSPTASRTCARPPC